MSAFARYPPRLQEAIVSRLGWTELRPVQEAAAEAILEGRNVVVLAPTAGGKTEAAIFPALAQLIERAPAGVGIIYVAPLKALLNNQQERIGSYAEMVGLRSFVWHGDVPDGVKRKFVRDPAEVLLTTPESLEVMLLSPRFPVKSIFSDLRLIVVDEVHAMAGTDRGAHLISVIERVSRFSAVDVQRVGLSATIGNPAAILGWLRGTSERPGEVVSPPKATLRRSILVALRESVAELAQEAARRAAGKKSLFFCQTRALTEAVADRMRGQGIDVFVHHSSVSLEERRAAEKRFYDGANACIVCTSTLELGIDVGDLDLVFQANAPTTVASFLQRMGRTGRRAGQVANTTFLCETAEQVLLAVAVVELARRSWVESVPEQARCWPVLVHQLLALTLQFGAISAERCWEQLSVVPDFRGIARDEFEGLVAHMKREDFLFEAGGLLSMGQKAERIYGKKNFLEMYAVFSSPVLYRVESTSGRELGSLEQDFVDRLVEKMSSFLLAGRAWAVDHVDHANRIVRVREAPRGEKPTWGGYVPQMIGFEICQSVKRILLEDATYPYVDPAASRAIQEWRTDLADLLRREGAAVRVDDWVARWWTFAGGRINYTLKHALEWKTGWKVIAGNFQLRIEGPGVSHQTLQTEVAKISADTFWASEETRKALASRVPEYRMSKFQVALPEVRASELLTSHLLDFDGAAGYLSRAGVVI